MHGLRDSNSRHLVLETSALPTELNPFLFDTKGVTQLRDTLRVGLKHFFSLKFLLPDPHQLFDLLHELQNEDLDLAQ